MGHRGLRVPLEQWTAENHSGVAGQKRKRVGCAGEPAVIGAGRASARREAFIFKSN